MPTVSCGFTFYICFQPYRILEPSSRPPLEISSPYLLISGHEIHLLVCLSTEEKKKEKPRNFSEPDLQTDWRGAERWSDTVWLPLNAEHVSTVLDWQRALDALPLCTAPQVSELCRVWAKVCVMVWESFHVFFCFFFLLVHMCECFGCLSVLSVEYLSELIKACLSAVFLRLAESVCTQSKLLLWSVAEPVGGLCLHGCGSVGCQW